jgi:hypothetical protein
MRWENDKRDAEMARLSKQLHADADAIAVGKMLPGDDRSTADAETSARHVPLREHAAIRLT